MYPQEQKELATVQKDMPSSREAYHTRFHDINVQRSYKKCTGSDHMHATVGYGESRLSDGGRGGGSQLSRPSDKRAVSKNVFFGLSVLSLV